MSDAGLEPNCWKVVSREGSQSFSSYSLIQFLGVRYVIGRPSHPRTGCGPLAVFRDFGDARDFSPAAAHSSSDSRIFAAHGTNLREPSCLDDGALWLKSGHRTGAQDLPDGTLLADSVTLLREVIPATPPRTSP